MNASKDMEAPIVYQVNVQFTQYIGKYLEKGRLCFCCEVLEPAVLQEWPPPAGAPLGCQSVGRGPHQTLQLTQESQSQ